MAVAEPASDGGDLGPEVLRPVREPARGRARGGPHAAALPTLWLDLLRQPSAGGRGARHAGRAPPPDAPGAAALRGDLGPARRIPRGGGAPRGVLTSRAAGGAGDEDAAGAVRRFRPRPLRAERVPVAHARVPGDAGARSSQAGGRRERSAMVPAAGDPVS